MTAELPGNSNGIQMTNTLVGCGGTGAHVALAFTRLHALGDPLGFFRHGMRNGKPMDLPALYLVDQDSGDGADEAKPTAWQTLRRVLDEHPSRAAGAGTSRRWPVPRDVTPLPVGADEDFLEDGRTLGAHYPNSDYLNCILSPEQRSIEFSRGMMGSPAVGACLFKLKDYDTRPDDPDINYDEVYNQLLNEKGRVAVVGSGVGGTGAAVGPTLAQRLSGSDERYVMAVMLLNWFEFDELAEHLGENRLKAQRRNMAMRENAHSGLRYYGNRLARHAATVPVGIPETAMSSRRFTGDNHQPMHEVYPHAVAAICCLRQFLDDDVYSNGLYHLDAQDPTRLGSGTGLPRGGTIGDLASQGQTLVATVATYEKVLESPDSKPVAPILCQLLGDRQGVAKALAELRGRYSKNLNWLRKMVGGDPEPVGGRFKMETAIRMRLKEDYFRPSQRDSPDQAAFEVFHWIARWVHDTARISQPGAPNGVYWPEIREDEGLTPSPRESGVLQKVARNRVRATLDSFVDPTLMTQNGWPDPVAAASYFREAIVDGRPTDTRQLELLFAGLLAQELRLRRNERGDNRPVSLDQLVEDQRTTGHDGLARYAIERPGRGGEVMGFTAPDTLFCPVPGLPDREWSALWQAVTGQRTEWEARRPPWGRATSDVERIRAWIDACSVRHPHATPPAWTRIFDGVTAGRSGYGGGTLLKVRWSDDELIDVFLPTRDATGLPPEVEGLPGVNPDDFLREHRNVEEGGERKFWLVQFEIAGEEREVSGIWDDHLRHLQAGGKIEFFWDDAARREVYAVTWSRDHGHRRVTLPNTLVLRRRDIGIQTCTPMNQVQVPNSDTNPGDLYPHYPVRWRYFDLLMPHGGDGDESLLRRLTRGDSPAAPPRPEIDGAQARWRLRMQGRSRPVNFVVRQEVGHKAHWMVWPRFHSLSWRAYYVYQHCTDPRVSIDTLWLDQDRSPGMLSRTKAKDDRSYPVRFLERAHAGGPPVALCARKRDEEIGLYLIQLDRLNDSPARMQIGIDFGTSHTTAAVQLGDRTKESVDLSPELSRDTGESPALSVHVSENMRHVRDPGGALNQGTWFPRYVEETVGDLGGLWPSEILTLEEVASVRRREPAILDWQPVRDYVIPPAGVLRKDLAKHIIANFKWNISNEFQGRESDLRRIYLDRIVEQTLAEVFVRHGRPSGDDEVQFTFTYPLRTATRDVKEYEETLRGVLEDGSRSLGCRLNLHADVGLFDESHATRVGTNRFGDVTMVGDLGGGTLDLIISAQEGSGLTFKDTADSAKLGGNVLLKMIADREGALPHGWGADPGTRLTQLAAWVRAKGLPALFGVEEARIGECAELGVRGFDDSVGPSEGREIIGRYFFLVGEFMARSLTAYLARLWLPKVTDKDQDSLRIRVYLRGNGWKLWHEDQGYDHIGRTIQNRVRTTVGRLWRTIDGAPASPGDERWRNEHHDAVQADRAKTDVVKHVVNRSERPESVRERWFSHTLVELSKVDENGARNPVNWFERVPFLAGGQGTNIEFAKIRPKLLLSGPTATRGVEVSGLPVNLTGRINANLQNKGEWVGDAQEHYQAPIAAWVWEAVLEQLI